MPVLNIGSAWFRWEFLRFGANSSGALETTGALDPPIAGCGVMERKYDITSLPDNCDVISQLSQLFSSSGIQRFIFQSSHFSHKRNLNQLKSNFQLAKVGLHMFPSGLSSPRMFVWPFLSRCMRFITWKPGNIPIVSHKTAMGRISPWKGLRAGTCIVKSCRSQPAHSALCMEGGNSASVTEETLKLKKSGKEHVLHHHFQRSLE